MPHHSRPDSSFNVVLSFLCFPLFSFFSSFCSFFFGCLLYHFVSFSRSLTTTFCPVFHSRSSWSRERENTRKTLQRACSEASPILPFSLRRTRRNCLRFVHSPFSFCLSLLCFVLFFFSFSFLLFPFSTKVVVTDGTSSSSPSHRLSFRLPFKSRRRKRRRWRRSRPRPSEERTRQRPREKEKKSLKRESPLSEATTKGKEAGRSLLWETRTWAPFFSFSSLSIYLLY